MTTQVAPTQVFKAANAAKWWRLRQDLDALGYPVGAGPHATRVDTFAGFTVTVVYPAWTLEVP